MQKTGFTENSADPCVFIRTDGEVVAIVAVYVDDLIILTSTKEEMEHVKQDMEDNFKMKDMGQLHYCLGISIEINVNEGLVWIHQRQYVYSMLKKFGLEYANPVCTPADMNVKLEKNDGVSQPADQKLFQSLVGSLLYAAMATRPDIAQAVGAVSKFNSNPSEAHMTAAKRILRYLKGTANFGLKYRKCTSTGDAIGLFGYSDADWAGDIDDRHSTTGIIYMMTGAAVSWFSKKQSVVALSTLEAEYIALSCASQEAVWIRRLLHDLGQKIDRPTVIKEDNQGAIAMAQNPAGHSRTKHIDIRHHFVREAIQDGIISLEYCPSKDMFADLLTKPLPRAQYERLRELVGVCLLDCIK
jgi:hypothetical protein